MALSELKCKIAGLNVLTTILAPDNRFITQSESYSQDFSGKPDIKIKFSESFLEKQAKENPALTFAETEYMWTGYEFCRKLLKYDGFVLHASAVAYNGKAYLFSAPSGTGKSTHTALWEKVFGSDAFIINDDKPALRLNDEKIYVYGTPWSGKTDKNKNVGVPLGGVCFLSRSPSNHIEKADTKSAIYMLLSQTLRYPSQEFMGTLLDFMDKNLPNIPVFRMGCNMKDEAAIMAYEFMSSHQND